MFLANTLSPVHFDEEKILYQKPASVVVVHSVPANNFLKCNPSFLPLKSAIVKILLSCQHMSSENPRGIFNENSFRIPGLIDEGKKKKYMYHRDSILLPIKMFTFYLMVISA